MHSEPLSQLTPEKKLEQNEFAVLCNFDGPLHKVSELPFPTPPKKAFTAALQRNDATSTCRVKKTELVAVPATGNQIPPPIEDIVPHTKNSASVLSSCNADTVPRHDATAIAPLQLGSIQGVHIANSFQSNPFYLFARDYSALKYYPLHKKCTTCSKDLWFLLSHRSKAFMWSRSRRSFKAKMRKEARHWKLSEADVDEMSRNCSSLPEFRAYKKRCIAEFTQERMRVFRGRGLTACEELQQMPEEIYSTTKNYVSWENNSCALDSIIDILPSILLRAKQSGIFNENEGSFPSSAFLSPAASVVGSLHYCHETSNSVAQAMFSNIVRQLTLDICENITGERQGAEFSWSPDDPDQGYLCLNDVFSFVLCPLLGGLPTASGSNTRRNLICSIRPITADSLPAPPFNQNIADFLLNYQRQSRPEISVFVLPDLHRKQVKHVAEFCSTAWESENDDFLGKVVAFVGMSEPHSAHFVSAICGTRQRLYVNDAMHNGGRFQLVDTMNLLTGTADGGLSLSVVSMHIVFLRSKKN